MASRFKIFSRCEGAVAVEFAIILPLLLFLMVGGMDLGHMYYIDHLITTASRDGARYGAKGALVAPTNNQIKAYASSSIAAGTLDDLVVDPVFSGVSPDKIITVTVTAHKHWFVLGSLTLFTRFAFHGFTNPQTRWATTSMKVEY